MVYLSGGRVVDSQASSWSITSIPQIFWGFVNFIVLFFKTMYDPSLSKKGNRYVSDYRPGQGGGGQGGGGQGPPGPPRRRFGGPGRAGGPAAPPMAGGG